MKVACWWYAGCSRQGLAKFPSGWISAVERWLDPVSVEFIYLVKSILEKLSLTLSAQENGKGSAYSLCHSDIFNELSSNQFSTRDWLEIEPVDKNSFYESECYQANIQCSCLLEINHLSDVNNLNWQFCIHSCFTIYNVYNFCVVYGLRFVINLAW